MERGVRWEWVGLRFAGAREFGPRRFEFIAEVIGGLRPTIERCLGGCCLMLGAEKNLRVSFARFSPVFAALGFVLCVAATAPAKTKGEAASTAAVRRQTASAQFARAEEQRAALNSKPSGKRTLADYKQLVNGYRRVALITPRAPEVPDSLLAVAELYTDMGDRFGRSYYQSAADAYPFLAHE